MRTQLAEERERSSALKQELDRLKAAILEKDDKAVSRWCSAKRCKAWGSCCSPVNVQKSNCLDHVLGLLDATLGRGAGARDPVPGPALPTSPPIGNARAAPCGVGAMRAHFPEHPPDSCPPQVKDHEAIESRYQARLHELAKEKERMANAIEK